MVNNPSVPARPSTPSIRLKEFITTIILRYDKAMLNPSDTSLNPNRPCMLVIRMSPKWIKIDAATTCPMNFFVADRTMRSSLRPMKNITIEAAKKYWNSGFLNADMDRSEAKRKTQKILTLPTEVTGTL